jgi:hypothetical protein
MHWRGDRSGANDPGGNALDEDAAFKRFNVAFAGLLGRSGPLTGPEMQAFTDFILQVTYPPNPIRNLDDSLTADQAAGRQFYFDSDPSDQVGTCNFCHALDPENGLFGGDGFSVVEPQTFKVPHLRNAYQKVGMFGMPHAPGLIGFNSGNNGFLGDQVRGFGYLHDGSMPTLEALLVSGHPDPQGSSNDLNPEEIAALVAFLHSIGAGTPPLEAP